MYGPGIIIDRIIQVNPRDGKKAQDRPCPFRVGWRHRCGLHRFGCTDGPVRCIGPNLPVGCPLTYIAHVVVTLDGSDRKPTGPEAR